MTPGDREQLETIPPEEQPEPEQPATQPMPPGMVDERATAITKAGTSPLVSGARRLLSIAILLALDLGGLTLGVYLSLVARELWVGNTPILWGALWQVLASVFAFLALVTVLVFWRAGLYGRRELRSGFTRVPSAVILVGLITFAFAIGVGHEFSTYLLFPTAVALTTISIGLLRGSYGLLSGAVLGAAGVRRRAALIGTGSELERLKSVLGVDRSGIRYEFLGRLGPADDQGALPVLGPLSELEAVLDETPRLDELIVSDADLTEAQLLDIVDAAHRRGVQVSVAPSTTEILSKRAQYVPGQGVPLFELRPPVHLGVDWLIKRSFDLVLGGLIILVGLPVWLLIAAAIKLDSSGPVFYRSRRIGLGERPFEMLKFRTMTDDAAARQDELEAANEAQGPLFKIRDDPRVTRVGRMLRRVSLDEIPNLINVLRGEMSLVGPRPLPLRDFKLLEPWHRKRYRVLPGMTGLWQISGRSDLGFDELVRLDFYYLENWSIWLDLQILLKTIPAVLRRRGAY
ncbi:MAG: sugar transferase [Gaiellaceae bacterium]